MHTLTGMAQNVRRSMLQHCRHPVELLCQQLPCTQTIHAWCSMPVQECPPTRKHAWPQQTVPDGTISRLCQPMQARPGEGHLARTPAT